MKWENYIVTDNRILLGKPIVKGTRISVDHLIKLLAQGWPEQQILENYPRMTKTKLKAVFAYLYECIQDGLLYTQPKKTA